MTNIIGLQYIEDFLAASRERELLAIIDSQPWLSDLKRRVQHYGYKYDYKKRAVDPTMYLGPLPDWAAELAKELEDRGLFSRIPDQLIVNEYQSGQGISPHVDCQPCFDDTVASITLGSGCMMDFTSIEDGTKISRFLERRSVVVLKGEARCNWRHAIAPRKSDVLDGQKVARHRRVSLTYRMVLLN